MPVPDPRHLTCAMCLFSFCEEEPTPKRARASKDDDEDLADATSQAASRRSRASRGKSQALKKCHICGKSSFDAMSGLTGSLVKAEMVQLPSCLGGEADKNYFIVTLDGLTCDRIHAMRRLRVSYAFGLSKEDVLLSAAKQLLEGQGRVVHRYHYIDQLDNRPQVLQSDKGLANIKSMQDFKGKIEKAMLKAGKVVEKSDQGAEKESSDSEGGKKVRQHSSGRLGKVQATAIKRRKGPLSAKGVPKRDSGANSAKNRESEVAALEDDACIPVVLQSVASALEVTPKCFANLHIDRILNGERLIRSVDAVPWTYRNSSYFSLWT